MGLGRGREEIGTEWRVTAIRHRISFWSGKNYLKLVMAAELCESKNH